MDREKNKTLFLLRSFKKHYHKVRKIYRQLSNNGNFSHTIEGREDIITSQITIPDEDLVVRFMVLMRRFLSQHDPLYYESFWKEICSEFFNELPEVEFIDNACEKLKSGYFGLNINGKDLTAEGIYDLISKADFFMKHTESQKQLQQLIQMPIVGQFLISQFYDYSLSAFRIISHIFDTIKRIEDSGSFKKNYLTVKKTNDRCIFCLSETGRFSSEEHVLPESLGNDNIVLPVGYVCDTCNNTTLSELDNFLINFGPIAFLRVQFVPFTKNGKLPKANFQNLSIEKVKPTQIVFKPKDKSSRIKTVKELKNGQTSFSMSFRDKQKFSPIKLARSLYKVALGTAAFDLGKERILQRKYNAARNFVLDKSNIENNLLMRMKGTPNPKIHIIHKQFEVGTQFFFDIFGMIFMINLEEKPNLKLTEELEKADFKLYALNQTF